MLPFFKQFPEITAVLSEKKDGSMKVFPERPEENRENCERFFTGQGIPADRVVSADQIHGTNVKIITAQNVSHNGRSSFIRYGGGRQMISDTDALVTKEKNIFLSVTAADCLPIFFYDPVEQVIGIAHAGWRGLTGGVIGKTIEAMTDCGAKTENVTVAFGPNIGKCHFEIQTDILPQFAGYEEYIIRRDDEIFINLQGIAEKQLQNAGIREANIETTPFCTFCERSTFFSYRRDKPKIAEGMVAVISMK